MKEEIYLQREKQYLLNIFARTEKSLNVFWTFKIMNRVGLLNTFLNALRPCGMTVIGNENVHILQRSPKGNIQILPGISQT